MKPLKLHRAWTALPLLVSASLLNACAMKLSMSLPINASPVFTVTPSNRLFPTDGANPPLVQGDTSAVNTFSWTATDAEKDATTITCSVSTLGLHTSDPRYLLNLDCSLLPSLVQSTDGVWTVGSATFTTSGGVASLTWNPTMSQLGTYQFTITASTKLGDTTSTFLASVREPYTTSLFTDTFDALFSEGSTGFASTAIRPRLDATALDSRDAWRPTLSSSTVSLTAGFATADPWEGTGLSTSPYRLALSGSDYFTLPSRMTGVTGITASAWISPNSPSAGSVLFGNGGGAGNGFVVRTSNVDSRQYVLEVGTSPTATYAATVTADAPRAYWKLNEINIGPTFATDQQGNHDGIYMNSPTGGEAGALEFETGTNTSVLFNGTNQYVSITDNAALDRAGTASYTFEAWIKPNLTDTTWRRIFSKEETDGSGRQGMTCFVYGGTASYMSIGCERFRDGASALVAHYNQYDLNTWIHVAHVYNGATMYLYVNGDLVHSVSTALNLIDNAAALSIGANSSGASNFSGTIDEFAYYQTALTSATILSHYRAGAGCRTKRPIVNGAWALIAATYSDTSVAYELFSNGVSQNCNGMTVAGGSFAGGDSTLTVGAKANGTSPWKGSISSLQLGPKSLSTTQHFGATAERFRATPVGNIVTDSLVRHFDAANANRGLGAHSDGCSHTGLEWTDLSSNAVPTWPYLIRNCVATSAGWRSTPSRFTTNADSNTYLPLMPMNAALNLGNTFSIELWLNASAQTGANMLFSNSGPNNQGAGVNRDGFRFYFNTIGAADGKLIVETGNGAASAAATTANGALSTGAWHQVVATVNRTTGVARIYVDGTEVTTSTTIRTDFDKNAGVYLLNSSWGGQYFTGSLAIARLYSTVLTQAQIRQNCHAQKSRYSITCAGP